METNRKITLYLVSGKSLLSLMRAAIALLLLSGVQSVKAQYTDVVGSYSEFRVNIDGSDYSGSDISDVMNQIQTSHPGASQVSDTGPSGGNQAIEEYTVEEIEEYDEYGSLVSSYQNSSSSDTGYYVQLPGGGGDEGEEVDDPDSNPTPTPETEEVTYYDASGSSGVTIQDALQAAGLVEDPAGEIEVMQVITVFEKVDTANGNRCPILDTRYEGTGTMAKLVDEGGDYCPVPADPLADECGPCQDGTDATTSSVRLRIPVGPGKYGGRFGYLRIWQHQPTASIFSPMVLEDDTAYGTLVLRDRKHQIRQVVSYDRILDVQVTSPTEYRINVYRRDPKVAANKEGLFPVAGTPFRYFVIKNTEAGKNQLTFEEHFPATNDKAQGRVESSQFAWTDDFATWTLVKGGDQQQESLTESFDEKAGLLKKTWVYGDPAKPEETTRRMLVYQNFPFGQKIIRQETGPVEKPDVKTWEYYTDRDENYRFGKVKQVVLPDGSWLMQDYDLAGRLALEVTPWKDSPVGSTPDQAKATYTNYQGLPTGHSDYRPFGKLEVKTTKILGIATQRAFTYSAVDYDGGRYLVNEQAAFADASFGDADNIRATTTHYPNWVGTAEAGQVKQVIGSDGSVRTYRYENGTYLGFEGMPGDFVIDGEFAFDRQTEVIQGTLAHPNGIPGKTTKSISVTDYRGNVVYQQTLIRTTPEKDGDKEWAEIAWTGHGYDDGGKKTISRDQTGIIGEYRYSPCCTKLEWQRDADGTETRFVYDDAGRVKMRSRKAPGQEEILVHYQFDQRGNVISETTEAGEFVMTTLRKYNKQGQLIATTGPDGLTTTYKKDTQNRRSITILPNNTTQVQDRFLDGRTKISHGTATIAQYYDYGVDAETGDRWSETITAKADGPRWSRSITNALGQSLRSEQPGSGEGVVIASHNRYDERGRLAVSAQSWSHSEKAAGADSENGNEPTMIGSPTLYVYDEETNEVLMSGSDLNGNGILEPGTDLVSKSESAFEKIDGNWYQISKQYAWPEIGNGEPILASESRRRINGLGIPHEKYGVLISESISRQRSANSDDDLKLNTENLTLETKSQTFRDAKTGLVTSISTTPTGLETIQRSKAGQVLTNSIIDPENPDQIIEMSYAYDPLGRRVASTDPRTGTSKTEYDPETGRVIAQIDSAGHRSTVDYYPAGHKNAGQMKSTTNPDGKTQYVAYTNLGQQLATWGNTSYPLDYQYNDYGEMIGMRTFKTSPATNPAELPKVGSTTQWHYDEATGQLLKKEYADGHGPEYQYSPTGQLLTRTWARSTNPQGDKLASQRSEDSRAPAPQDSPMKREGTFAKPTGSVREKDSKAKAPNPESQLLNPSAPSRLATNYTYDEKTNLLTNVTYPDGTGITYNHDAFGRTTKVTDLTGTREFEYHKKTGQLIAEHVTLNSETSPDDLKLETENSQLSYTIDRSYTELGQPKKVSLSGDLKLNTENLKLSHEVAYQWTKTNQLAAVTSPAGKFSYQYDSNNPALLRGITAPAHNVTYDYEPDRNLIASVTNRSSDPTIKDPISQYRYRNDSLARRDLIAQSGSAFQKLSTGENTIEVAYNDLSEVIGTKSHTGIPNNLATFDVQSSTFDVQRSQSFVFDAIGNRKSQTTELGDQRSEISYESNSLNQYTAIRAEEKDKNNLRASAPLRETSPSHDQDGNLLEDDRNTYTWNAENRLTTVKSKDGKSRTEYLYDYQGRRTIKKSFTRGGQSENFELQTTNAYLYDGWNLLAEIENGQAKTYTWGRDLSGSMQGAGGVGGLLAITSPEFDVQSSTFDVQRSKNRFAIYDANGNVGQMIAEDSSIKAAYQYSSFGSVTATFGEEADSNPWRFSTKPVEANTGWSYYGFRYYDAADGRWASRDPIGESSEKNLYAFIRNRPIQSVDLLGLIDFESGRSNCLGFALTGKTGTYAAPSAPSTVIGLPPGHVPNADKSLIDDLKTEGWDCDKIDKTADCKCECDYEQIIIVVYKNENTGNDGKDPLKDPIVWGKDQRGRTDLHAMRSAGGGCYREVSHAQPAPGIETDANPADWDGLDLPMLCCCKTPDGE